MTTDISRQFEDAHERADTWSNEAVHDALRVLASWSPDLQVDWEEGDEEWGRVVQGDVHVAIVCARIPLIVLHKSLTEVANQWDENSRAVFVVAESFEEQRYSVNRSLLERVFDREVSSNISYNLLSINDLWWATV